jgi:hypothetical protein
MSPTPARHNLLGSTELGVKSLRGKQISHGRAFHCTPPRASRRETATLFSTAPLRSSDQSASSWRVTGDGLSPRWRPQDSWTRMARIGANAIGVWYRASSWRRENQRPWGPPVEFRHVGRQREWPLREASEKTKGITDFTDQTNSTDRSLTHTPPLATSRGDVCSTTSGCNDPSTGPNELDGCAVVKDLFAAPRWAWSAAERGTIRRIGAIGQIRIPWFCSRLRQTSHPVGKEVFPEIRDEPKFGMGPPSPCSHLLGYTPLACLS